MTRANKLIEHNYGHISKTNETTILPSGWDLVSGKEKAPQENREQLNRFRRASVAKIE